MTTTRYLIIDKVNEVYLKIEAEADIRRELGEYFTFEVPGFKFMPQYRNRVWDGKIRLFSYATGKIYAGLYPYIKNWCKENNVHIVDGTKIKEKTVDNSKIDDLIKALKLPHEVRDYQREAFKYSVEKDRCLLVSPTASGKSLIIYLMLIYNLLRLKDTKEDKILVIVPTTSLVEQLYKDFKDYGYNSERNVHRIYSGHEKETNKRVIISTWQSVYQLPKKWFSQFGMIIGDEAHLFKAVSLTKLMTKLEKTKYRVGLTGTLDGSKTHKLVLEGLFGPVNKVVSTSELMETGKLAELKIMCLILQHDQTARHFLKDKTYQEEMDYLVSNEKRNKYIRNLATSLNGNTLCLFQYVEKHGKNLYETIRERATDKQVFYVHGGVDAEQREKIREITEKSDNAIIVASYGTFSTGINIRNLHNIVFASPSKSRIRNLQSIGRGLRLKDDNSAATLYDLADDISYKGKENYTLHHFKERINIYNSEDFNYEIHNVELTNGRKDDAQSD
ncbi:DEAD/DEAH box helicase family protein [bacterium]|nr:DEAD/DEAH box helicase family protein [bacterium]